MPPLRLRSNTNANTNTNTNTNNTNTNITNPTIQELAQIISQQVVVVLPTLVTQLNQAANTNPVHNNGKGGLAPTLTDNHVKAGTLTRKGTKKVEFKSTID
ncbi:hypothetical protein R6Q57_014227 [Mikania cordata]